MIELDLRDFSVVSDSGRVVLHQTTVSFSFERVLGVSGPSGSGKTVFVRALLNLLPRGLTRHGEVALRIAARIGDFSSELPLEEVVMIPQSPLSSLPVSISIGALIQRVVRWADPNISTSRLEGRLRELSDRVQLRLDKIADYQAVQLSGGMAQRVMLALVLARGARLIVMDEPTYGLDEEICRGIEKTLLELARSGTHLIVISHEIGFFQSVCDAALSIDDGYIGCVS